MLGNACRLLTPGKQQTATGQYTDDIHTATTILAEAEMPLPPKAESSSPTNMPSQGSSVPHSRLGVADDAEPRQTSTLNSEGHLPAEADSQQPLQQQQLQLSQESGSEAADAAGARRLSQAAWQKLSRRQADGLFESKSDSDAAVPQGIQMLLNAQPQSPPLQPQPAAPQPSDGASPAEPGVLLLLCTLNLMPRCGALTLLTADTGFVSATAVRQVCSDILTHKG